MPMDVDAIAASRAVEELTDILNKMPYAGKAQIADDYLRFASEMRQKYGNGSQLSVQNSNKCSDEYADSPDNEWQDMFNNIFE